VLGFANSSALARAASPDLITSMRDLYAAWAEKRLPADEDSLAGFCGFVGTRAGEPLRLDGLLWIAKALQKPEGSKWYRGRTSSAFMEFLGALVTETGDEVLNRQDTRQALLDLLAVAVSRQLPAALALQDRAKKLL